MVLIMKFFANLKKLNKLGASMVEYAIVLACISAFGASFSDNLTNTLNGVFNKVTGVITGAESDSSQTLTEKIKDILSSNTALGNTLCSGNFNTSVNIDTMTNSNDKNKVEASMKALDELLGKNSYTIQSYYNTQNGNIHFVAFTEGRYTTRDDGSGIYYPSLTNKNVDATVFVYEKSKEGFTLKAIEEINTPLQAVGGPDAGLKFNLGTLPTKYKKQ